VTTSNYSAFALSVTGLIPIALANSVSALSVARLLLVFHFQPLLSSLAGEGLAPKPLLQLTTSEARLVEIDVEVEVNLRQTVSRPVCLGVRFPSGIRDQFFFHLEISFRQLWVCYFVASSLTRGRVCKLLYIRFLVLPEQSLLGRSPAELTAIFYCLI
jgi:hypothetical protein